MKKRIIIGLSTFSFIFLAGGLYIIASVERTTATLGNLIQLHQVELLREQLLLRIKRAQADLSLKNTRFARGVQTIVYDVKAVSELPDVCLGCHHSGDALRKLTQLKGQINTYQNAVSRVLTMRANVARLEAEEDSAFRAGERLIDLANAMVTQAKGNLEIKTQAALAQTARTKTILFSLCALGALLAIGLAFVFIRGFTKPVGVLLNATRRFKGGDLDHRVHGLKDEFGEMAESLNEMASSLKEQIYRMRRAEQMAVAGQMATGLAHEIKNPLAGIKASMQVLSERPDLPGEDRALLLRVIDEVQRIDSLIKGLLNFAKPPKPQFVLSDVNTILDSTVALAFKCPSFSLNKSNGIHIFREYDDPAPVTMVDPLQLRQVFLNLFLNAVEAMPEGGALRIKTTRDRVEDSIKIQISDTGKGINEEVMGKIFDPFFTTKSKGTGLGLAITKQLVEQHGGTVDASDHSSDGGTTFTIILPVKADEVEHHHSPERESLYH